MIPVDPFWPRIFCDSTMVECSCEVPQVTAAARTVPCPPVAASSIAWSSPTSTDPCGSTSLWCHLGYNAHIQPLLPHGRFLGCLFRSLAGCWMPGSGLAWGWYPGRDVIRGLAGLGMVQRYCCSLLALSSSL